MKKATTNVDWIISLGIFLTYILFLFIFLKPGIKDVYKEESLFNILENNIYSEANYTLDIVPLYLHSDENGCFEVQCDFEAYSWEDNLVIVDSNNQELDVPVVSGDGDEIIFVVDFTLNKDINSFLLHSNKDDYGPVTLCEETTPTVPPSCKLGTKEVVEGLDELSLTGISNKCNINYENLKEEWNFPLGKDFSLYEDEGEGYINLCNAENEQNQTNVFVKEFKDMLIDKYGNTKDIMINMRIW